MKNTEHLLRGGKRITAAFTAAGLLLGGTVCQAAEETESGAEGGLTSVVAEPPAESGEGMDANEWQMTQEYQDWRSAMNEKISASQQIQDEMMPYYQKTMRAFLQDEGQNAVYSPVNVYIALAMLAECTDGSTRSQILDLLNADDTDELEEKVQALWEANTVKTPIATKTLANSLWLSDDFSCRESLLTKLAEIYHASSFTGDLSSDEINDALRQWINGNTGGLLQDQAENFRLNSDTVLALVSTLYLKAAWTSQFDEDDTTQEEFTGKDGTQTVSMMHQTINGAIYSGEGFSAVGLPMEDCGTMWIFLPDEGQDVQPLVDGDDVYSILSEGDQWEDITEAEISLSLPKFDVSSEMSLKEELENLGVSEVFDGDAADFSPLTDGGCYVSEITHAARVRADENGTEAAAYTAVQIGATAFFERQQVDFTVDRPFLFVITGEDGSVLLAGIVNQPDGSAE
ncbi:MAG: serpin family protein [Lachnospiraceae bacterium]